MTFSELILLFSVSSSPQHTSPPSSLAYPLPVTASPTSSPSSLLVLLLFGFVNFFVFASFFFSFFLCFFCLCCYCFSIGILVELKGIYVPCTRSVSRFEWSRDGHAHVRAMSNRLEWRPLFLMFMLKIHRTASFMGYIPFQFLFTLIVLILIVRFSSLSLLYL